MILGALIAGGRSSRFGSDKAAALLNGAPLLDHALAALARQCDSVVVVGRDAGRTQSIPDWPAGGCGPLGGIAAALRHAASLGFDQVLTTGVDSVGLPEDLIWILQPAPAYVATQPVIGLWPASARIDAQEMLSSPGSHAVRAFADRIGARPVNLERPPANINTPADLTHAARSLPNAT